MEPKAANPKLQTGDSSLAVQLDGRFRDLARLPCSQELMQQRQEVQQLRGLSVADRSRRVELEEFFIQSVEVGKPRIGHGFPS